ncbi:MAG: hypothetical protein RLO53_07745 [Salinisphaeraceae bacterium]
MAGHDSRGCPIYRVRERQGGLSRLYFYLGAGDYYVLTYRNSRCNLGYAGDRYRR